MVKSNKLPKIGEEMCRRIGREHAQMTGYAVRHNIQVSPSAIAEETIYWFLTGRNYWRPPQHPNCPCSVVLISKEDLKR